MAENRSRFVLLCQQGLAFAVVVAITAPATNLVSLDIVAPPRARQAAAGTHALDTAAYSPVAEQPVRPRVRAVALAGVSGAGPAAPRHRRPAASTASTASTVLSASQRVSGLATVGVTWGSRARVPDRAMTVSVRTSRGGTWSPWTRMPYHRDEGPDPASPEGRAARAGTDPVYVGAVDEVQVKALSVAGTTPAGMRLWLVDPGRDTASPAEKAAIDTGRLHPAASATTGTGSLTAAARVTRRPIIHSRAQWGADERMRDRRSLHYGEVHGGFVHHTVNANGYSRAAVPAIIRGIYAYHTQSRGWSDIGYNFLVDRFGRIWEGRYGGVDRPVVGAHTLGYNDDAFAMSAIGNFDTARPSRATVTAFGRLFAWKLSLHGVRGSSRRQWVNRRILPAIDGHRDVGRTACPGRYLYAKIPTIRRLAARYQLSFAPRRRNLRVAGSARPVIVARDRASKQAFLIRSAAHGRVGRVTRTGTYLRHAGLVVNAGDWNGDGRGDVITRSRLSGRMYLYRGTGTGRLRAPVKMNRISYARVRLFTAVGDMTGDGRPDLLGQPIHGAMRIYPGNGAAGIRRSYAAHSAITAIQQLGVGLWNRDGAPDSVLRRGNGALVLYPGNGPGGLMGGRRIGSVGRGYDWLLAVGDLTGDRRPDLVARARSTGRLWLLPGSSRGFVSRRSFATGMGRFDLAG